MAPRADWSSIPDDILTSIAGKIVSVDDYVSFSSVCRYWHSLATDHYNNHKPIFQPLFMSGTNPGSKTIKFRNPSSGKTLTVDLPHETAGTTRFWGSPFGWLIISDTTRFTLRLSLFNPLTGATIPLPDYSDSYRINPDKLNVFLTANPDSDPDNCLVLLHPREWSPVLFLRLGKRWCCTSLSGIIDDFTYFSGTLYGLHLDRYGFISLQRFNPDDDDDDDDQRRSLNYKLFHEVSHSQLWPQTHVFVFNGELCMCVRYCYFRHIKTEDNKIFRIDTSNGGLTPVTSLGDHCLFLGSNYSFACKASYPRAKFFEGGEGGKFVSNLVFFSYRKAIRAYSDRPFDVEVWDMSRSRVCRKRDAQAPLSESLWIVPSLTMFSRLEDISAGRS